MIALLTFTMALVVALSTVIACLVESRLRGSRERNVVQVVGADSTAIQAGGNVSIRASSGSVAAWAIVGDVVIGAPAIRRTARPETDDGPNVYPVTDFSAICTCPRCGYADTHYLRPANGCEAPATTQRTCTQCGETWGQK